MKETDSSNFSGRQPTPPPAPTPSWLDSKPSSPPDDDTLEEDLLRQIESLSQLVAESAMAEIDRHFWVDLRAIKSTRYQAGNFKVILPGPDDPEPTVKLSWTAGKMLLSEALQRTEENTLALALPPVRALLGWTVSPPAAGRIPPAPAPLSQQAREIPDVLERWERAHRIRRQAWQTHLAAWTQVAETTRDELLEATRTDEEELAYAGMRMIQARRRDPQAEPEKTISAELETLAEHIRARWLAADGPSGEEPDPG